LLNLGKDALSRSPTMKTIEAIINLQGGLAVFRYVRIEVAHRLPLTIERIGFGPRGRPQVAVAHYCERNGDLLRDPEVVFEVLACPGRRLAFSPISCVHDPAPERLAVYADADGLAWTRAAVDQQIRGYARAWDRTLREQGFLEVACAQNRSKS
jgi:Domain of unknown function (DUF6908)